MKDWKDCERRIAEVLGGVRVPVSGRQRDHAPDVEHSTLAIEVKSRKRLPNWLEDALRLAEASAEVCGRFEPASGPPIGSTATFSTGSGFLGN